MHTRVWSTVIVLACLGFAGAGGESPYEQTVKQMLGSLETINAKLKTIGEEESAAAAKPDLRKAANAFVEARTKAEKLQQPEKHEKDRLTKLYKPKLDAARKVLSIQMRRVELIHGGKDALQEIAGILKKDAK